MGLHKSKHIREAPIVRQFSNLSFGKHLFLFHLKGN